MLSLTRSAAISLLVAACGQAPYPGAEPQRAEEAASHAYAAASDAARAAGSLTVERGGLVFGHGVTLYTRQLAPRSALDPASAAGESYADLAGLYAERVELRRVIEQQGGRLCGASPPGYAGLLIEGERAVLILFTGDEPPGPEAGSEQICAVLEYARS